MRSDAHQLCLDPLSETTWRLRDRAVATCDADSVVAYVELRPDGLYEATWVAHGIGTATYPAIADLLRAAADLLGEPDRRGSHKPVPIPHRPPLAV